MRQIRTTLAIAVMYVAAPPVGAHHSLAVYSNEVIELEGEITGIAWQNPHVIFELQTPFNFSVTGQPREFGVGLNISF